VKTSMRMTLAQDAACEFHKVRPFRPAIDDRCSSPKWRCTVCFSRVVAHPVIHGSRHLHNLLPGSRLRQSGRRRPWPRRHLGDDADDERVARRGTDPGEIHRPAIGVSPPLAWSNVPTTSRRSC
jgi:hypothetical protein